MNRFLQRCAPTLFAFVVVAASVTGYRMPALAGYVQTPQCSTSGSSTIALLAAPTNGNIVVVAGGAGGADFTTVTGHDSNSATLTRLTAITSGVPNTTGIWAYTVSGSPTATYTMSVASYYCVYEISGGSLTGLYASSDTPAGSPTTISAAISGVTANSAMIGVGWVNNTGTLGLTFSNTASTVTDANVATTFIGVHGSATATTSTTATLATGSGGTIGAMSWIAIPGGGGGATFVGSDLTRTAAAVITAPSSVQLTGNAPSGGTPPYSYQWQRSLTAVGGYASLSGKTSLSLTDTSVTNGTLYFYQLVESDSASNTYTTPFIATYAPTNATINICWIGDSITEGLHTTVQTTPQAEEHALLWDFPFTNVTGTNEGVSGLATNDWVSGGSYLPAAITACKAAGANYVQIMLGTNDASTNYNDSTATFISNYDNITAYINAQMPGVPIIINAPSYADYLRYGTPYTNAWYAKITGYVAALGTITGSNVHIGDKTAFTYFSGANDYNYLYDGVHPNDNGATILGGLWAQAFFNVTGLGPPRATPRVGSSQINGG